MFVLCLFVPFPHGYKVSRGGPGYCAFDQTFYDKSEIDCFTIAYSSPRKYKSILWDFFASVCKQPPNANRSVGFSPINCPIQQKQHIISMRFFKIWGPQKILCTFGEKEHASKRASIIASDNVTSKAKCATRGQQGVLGIVQIEDKQQSDAKCLQS